MDDTLKRLLEAEIKAEALVTQAIESREELTRQALEEARLAEDRLLARIPEIRGSFMDKTRQRIEQNISEMQRRFDERAHALRSMAEESREDAIQAAMQIILDPDLS
ncbi:MAG TPA: ATPase [Thiolapillus brandeum]|uniref:ATPase n=1 Tax=Thiolapillus brandeum TaxID=1076588 RepID=A0A831KB38_9GAMM|nr:ATPase [Thiolapillus brandeum]